MGSRKPKEKRKKEDGGGQVVGGCRGHRAARDRGQGGVRNHKLCSGTHSREIGLAARWKTWRKIGGKEKERNVGLGPFRGGDTGGGWLGGAQKDERERGRARGVGPRDMLRTPRGKEENRGHRAERLHTT